MDDNKYPVIIDGTACGVLRVTREGLMTVFEAECPEQDRLIRLSVFGSDGTEGKLGVMMPENGILHLRKSFSRTSLELFPKEIAAAGESGVSLPESAGVSPKFPAEKNGDSGDDAGESRDGEDDCPQESRTAEGDDRGDSQSEEACPGETEEPEDCAEESQSEPDEDCGCDAEERENPTDRDMLWFPVPEGTLVSIDSPSLLAMPWHEGIAYGEERVIEGRRYAVISPGEIAIPAES